MNMLKKIFILFLLIPVFVYAQTLEKQVVASIDTYLSEKYPANEPGASVLIVKNNKVFFRKGYGLANVESKTTVTPDMVFRIGSVTKQFTSVAILKLVEQGRIKLTDDITTYLPDYPTRGKKITVEHLLT